VVVVAAEEEQERMIGVGVMVAAEEQKKGMIGVGVVSEAEEEQERVFGAWVDTVATLAVTVNLPVLAVFIIRVTALDSHIGDERPGITPLRSTLTLKPHTSIDCD
jgi:hypothetical protein